MLHFIRVFTVKVSSIQKVNALPIFCNSRNQIVYVLLLLSANKWGLDSCELSTGR